MFPIPRFPFVRAAFGLALTLSVPGLGVHLLVAQVPGGVSDSLVFHLRADDVLDNGGSPSPASGDSVATWNDVSATATEHDFTDAVDIGAFGDLTPPLFAPGDDPRAINYRPVVDFSALDMGLSTPDDPALNSVSHDLKSFSVVFRTSTDAGTGTEVVFEEGGTVNGLNVYTRNGALGLGGWAQGAPSGWSLWGETAVGSQEVHLASLVFDGIRDSLVAVYVDGQLLASDTAEYLPAHTGNVAVGQLRDGSRGAGWASGSGSAFHFGGQLAEMVYYNQAWNAAERARVESGLAIRYGVPLAVPFVDASGGVLWDPAANAGFTEGATAIVRDDAGGLDQRQARSSAPGSVLSVGLDTVVASQAAHGVPFSADGHALFFSHDGSLPNATATGAPAGSSLILERVWQVREPAGEVGDVDLVFHLDAFSLPGTMASDYVLYVRNGSSDFTTGATAHPASAFAAGDRVVFDGIDLDDGDRFTLGTSSGLVGPADVAAGLSLWFSADRSVSTVGSGVSDWGNRSASVYRLVQPDGAERPVLQSASSLLNFNPVVNFDGTSQYLAVTGLNYHTGQRIGRMAFCAVFRTTHSTTNNWALLDFDRSEYFNVNVSDAGRVEMALADGSISDLDGATTGLNDGRGHVACTYYDNTLVNDAGIRTDGRVDLDQDVKAGGSELGAGTTLTRYGFVGDGSEASGEDGSRNNNYYEGDIAELAFYEGVGLGTAELERIETYLAVKYGVHLEHDYLASDATVAWDASTLAAWHHDVFGLGRDDDGGLLQKQSRAEGVGSALTLALGALAATNAANGGSFATDGTYLLVGHDGGTTDATDAGVPSGYEVRLNRTWRAAETGGDAGTLQLRFHLDEIVLPGSAIGDFALVVKNGDSDFTVGATTHAASAYDGTHLDFTGINLADDDRFTLLSQGQYEGPAPGGVLGSLELWFAADSGLVTSGTAVTDWGNSAPKAPSMTQTVSGNRPALLSGPAGVNFNDALSFDGGDFLPVSQLNLQTPIGQLATCAVFRTAYSGTAYNDNWSLLDYDRSEWFNLYVRGDDGRLGFSYMTGQVRDNYSATGGYNDGLPHLVCARYDRTLTDETLLRVDGAVGFEDNLEAGGTTIGTANNRYGFVGDGSEADTYNGSRNNLYYQGDLPELALFLEDTVTDADLDRIETYLGLKYGIHLAHDYVASNDAVIWDAAALAGWHHDVAGIGKDLASGLDQRKSRNNSGDDVLTVWLGAHTDEATPDPFAADLSFMLWGNDDGRLDTVISTDLPSGLVERIPREWRFAEQEVLAFTGPALAREVGQVSLQFDLTGLSGSAGVSPGTPEDSLLNLRLLVSATSDFSAASAYPPSAVDVLALTATFTVPGPDIGDGSHVTLGSVGPTPLPVTWTAFTAEALDAQVALDWSTGTERDAAYFEPQRSPDGQSWTALGVVPATGGSAGADYAFTDTEPLSGWAFYRIRQVDEDGTEDHSVVRAVRLDDAGTPPAVWPNPASGPLHVRFEAPGAGTVRWRLVDRSGRGVASGEGDARAGENRWNLDAGTPAAGLYLLELRTGDGYVLLRESVAFTGR